MRRSGWRFAGLGHVAEAGDEVFEAALQGGGILGGKVGASGREGAEQKQEGFGEEIGGGAGGG